MRVRQDRDWFSLTGEVMLDDQNVLDMRTIVTLLESTSSRFLPLGSGEFVALTESFRRRLDDLTTLSHQDEDGIRFHHLAAMTIRDLTEGVGEVVGDAHWKRRVRQLQDVQERTWEVPAMLRAQLRNYQVDGFEWLCRLADLGVGACLADDMGLGKTLQTIALLLHRSKLGASLVIAPASLVALWQEEMLRFAPTLNAIVFSSSDRETVLHHLGPSDVVVCTYTLLQNESKRLSDVEWNVVVLDEAQAIKNAATKRSKAAMALQGQFKLITTGTPIENHLGELWNLFCFINPGLLGSQKQFRQRFAVAIERDHDRKVQNQLQRLIRPLILRRTKTQVLTELPPRTDIVLRVEMSDKEASFYEALRQRAVERLEDMEDDKDPKHIKIFAEMMKLRRACCNPRLVTDGVDIPSAKLDAFVEIVTELRKNRHKALVFSQFVGHLSLVREYLEKHTLSYQYLDGQTTLAQRKKRVQAFQSGEGDLFLISLKAGGVGLNLTAADYVIHLDPWWNPAVEDQASDRAHRIGQTRPVTVYRLVMRGTIEEKIVDLHQQKRDLAGALLAGTDTSGKLSAAELIELIRQP